MILITAATGKTGSELVKVLAAAGTPCRVFVRHPEKLPADLPDSVEIAQGDLSDRSAVEKAVAGIDKAVLITANAEDQLFQEKQFVDCAKAAGVSHILYLSSMESVPEATNVITRIHVESEEYIRNSGIHYTMIRPTFFMQNLLGSARTIAANDTVSLPVGSARIVATDLRDVAAVIAKILEGDSAHLDNSYDLTGPEGLTMDEIAGLFSQVLGREIRYVEQPIDAFGAVMQKVGFPEWRVNAICEEFKSIAGGSLGHTTTNIESIIGRPPTSMEQFIRDHIAVYAG
jgi:uncharacterized protein YbjT (DUF2867 family)